MRVSWLTAYGRRIPLGIMSTDHINSCMWAIGNNSAWENGCQGFSNKEWLMIFSAELTRRKRFT